MTRAPVSTSATPAGTSQRKPRRGARPAMLTFLVKRIGAMLLTVLGLSMAVFALVQLLPGDLARSVLGQYATDDQIAAFNDRLGVDRPFFERYLDWLVGFVTGNWGVSERMGIPAREVILERLGNSVILAVAALVVVVPLAVAAGAYAASRRGSFADRAISVSGVSLMAIPEFVSGVLLLVVFGVYLRWLPVQSTVPTLDPVDIVRQLTLPVIPLCLILFGYIARMMRATTMDVLDTDYVRTATVKGIPPRQLFWRHVMRNAILPTLTVIAGQAGYLIGGLVIVETLFSYPGIGNFAYESAKYHDVEPLTGSVVLIGVTVLMFNFIGDLATVWLNPRVREGSK